MASDHFEQLIYTKSGEVVEITLNRPDALNALSLELYGELGDAVTRASGDAEVQVVVITGAGRAFSTGGDLKQGDKVNREDPRLFAEVSNRMLKAILESEKVVVAKVNGITQAGGLLVVAACDLAIASDRATFKCPEALVGLWEPYGPALLVPQIGIKRAKQMLLTCETVAAAEAERIGLVNRVVAHEELDVATRELIERIVATGPKARSMFKRMTNQYIREFDTNTVIEALGSEEGREGMAAFAEKRRPSWRRGS
jgi:enoyl-CoA hydratase/carnithine racemase